MAYCRWSTNDFTCDAYIYQDATDDKYIIDVSVNRMVVSELNTKICQIAAHKGYMRTFLKYGFPERVPIDLPFAGTRLYANTPGECAARVRELVALGYNIPEYVAETLLDEQRELDALKEK